jgi:CheY-like chemotaxis protein
MGGSIAIEHIPTPPSAHASSYRSTSARLGHALLTRPMIVGLSCGTLFPTVGYIDMTYPKLHNAPVVLVVEDDAMTRLTATDAFQDAGFVVFEAANAGEALSILAVNSADAIFTDIQIQGGMNGVSLAVEKRERWPWIKMAVASGEGAPCAAAMPYDIRFFSKPYDIGRVVDHLQHATLASA